MIVQEADHPFILFGELEVSLPEAVAVLTLESTLAPNPSRRLDWIIQSGLDENSMDGCVADCALLVVVVEVSFDAAWSPITCPSELEYEVHCGL